MAIFHIKYRFYGTRESILVRIDGHNREGWQTTIALIKNKWKEFAGEKPLQYTFVDQTFANTFKSSEQFGKSLTTLSGLAILIASLGLLGMIIFTLEQRTKEIGIRKVSGASVYSIVILIFKEYSKLITVAFIISAPVAYWLVNQWLQDFEYRIIPSPLIFILAGVGTLLLAAAITSYHSIKAALTNPVEVLRDE
jgi:putative ABC transport system permease protein